MKIKKIMVISSISIGLVLAPIVSHAGTIMTGLATYGAVKVGEKVIDHYSEENKDKKDKANITQKPNPLASQQPVNTVSQTTLAQPKVTQQQVPVANQLPQNQIAPQPKAPPFLTPSPSVNEVNKINSLL